LLRLVGDLFELKFVFVIIKQRVWKLEFKTELSSISSSWTTAECHFIIVFITINRTPLILMQTVQRATSLVSSFV